VLHALNLLNTKNGRETVRGFFKKNYFHRGRVCLQMGILIIYEMYLVPIMSPRNNIFSLTAFTFASQEKFIQPRIFIGNTICTTSFTPRRYTNSFFSFIILEKNWRNSIYLQMIWLLNSFKDQTHDNKMAPLVLFSENCFQSS
jgi:hypothetical protein